LNGRLCNYAYSALRYKLPLCCIAQGSIPVVISEDEEVPVERHRIFDHDDVSEHIFMCFYVLEQTFIYSMYETKRVRA
jgi:hypothetical protein